MKNRFIPVEDTEGRVGYVNVNHIQAICNVDGDTLIMLTDGTKIKSSELVERLLNDVREIDDAIS